MSICVLFIAVANNLSVKLFLLFWTLRSFFLVSLLQVWYLYVFSHSLDNFSKNCIFEKKSFSKSFFDFFVVLFFLILQDTYSESFETHRLAITYPFENTNHIYPNLFFENLFSVRVICISLSFALSFDQIYIYIYNR